jgi:antitoxin component YwqK of YwqJK toxin-antitoxin module
MPSSDTTSGIHTDRYKNGSVKAKGPMSRGQLTGYWEWFRRDGSKLRSGYFDHGQPVGEWTTYDRNGNVYKVTQRQKP